MGPANTQD